mmetsp:Transcript_17103/g.42430  ORF Transcript_17103/g.42430 Transcript_17103/m.42430 type:complete len:283 (-) Transcript_17103:7806-8654(-)
MSAVLARVLVLHCVQGLGPELVPLRAKAPVDFLLVLRLPLCFLRRVLDRVVRLRHDLDLLHARAPLRTRGRVVVQDHLAVKRTPGSRVRVAAIVGHLVDLPDAAAQIRHVPAAELAPHVGAVVFVAAVHAVLVPVVGLARLDVLVEGHLVRVRRTALVEEQGQHLRADRVFARVVLGPRGTAGVLGGIRVGHESALHLAKPVHLALPVADRPRRPLRVAIAPLRRPPHHRQPLSAGGRQEALALVVAVGQKVRDFPHLHCAATPAKRAAVPLIVVPALLLAS